MIHYEKNIYTESKEKEINKSNITVRAAITQRTEMCRVVPSQVPYGQRGKIPRGVCIYIHQLSHLYDKVQSKISLYLCVSSNSLYTHCVLKESQSIIQKVYKLRIITSSFSQS